MNEHLPFSQPQNKWFGKFVNGTCYNKEYVVIKNASHEHMCYKFIQDNNIT